MLTNELTIIIIVLLFTIMLNPQTKLKTQTHYGLFCF